MASHVLIKSIDNNQDNFLKNMKTNNISRCMICAALMMTGFIKTGLQNNQMLDINVNG